MNNHSPSLARNLGIVGLIATGVCSMLGASIYVVPFMIQKHVPGIGPNVLLAFVFAAIPAILAAVAYSALASAMPKAGGSYIYASRGLHPYLGFVASFSQWFGLSIVIGVVAYVTIPFIRDIFIALSMVEVANVLEMGVMRVGLALTLVWVFVWVNIRGANAYEKAIIPMMALMFLLGGMVIVAGFYFDQSDFIAALALKSEVLPPEPIQSFNLTTFLGAASLLFASYIGFDSIAQAGGEAKNPAKSLPLAIFITIVIVGGYYMLFTSAVYNTVPWWYVANQSLVQDVTAPGLLAPLLPPWLTICIVAGAAIALINDLPAMLLSVSRLMFAWSLDGIFPSKVALLHSKFGTPANALIVSGVIASIGILGSHFAGSFFLGIDIMVTSMMVNFLLMCLTLVTIDAHSPSLASSMTILKSATLRKLIGSVGVLVLLLFLTIHLYKELTAPVAAWYFRATYIWLAVMIIASLVYFTHLQGLKRLGVNIDDIFKKLPN